jgi:ParB family chromosome partitioning protein
MQQSRVNIVDADGKIVFGPPLGRGGLTLGRQFETTLYTWTLNVTMNSAAELAAAVARRRLLEMALIENIQRENLNAIEIALSYQRLLTECHLKQEELGERVGKNRTTVTNYLRLLKLPPDIQIAVRDNKLSMGQARAIISIENPEEQLYIFKKTLEEDLSVRKVEELVREMTEKSQSTRGESSSSVAPPASREIQQLQSKLSSYFGTRVVIKSDGKRGEIKIPFLSVEDLNRGLDILKVGL